MVALSAATRDIKGILARRGILGSATRHDWLPQGERGWRYPIYDLSGQVIGYRLKLLEGRQKYLWSPEKPQHDFADWYILPDTVKAIAAASGICYLANGEPALHAYHDATIHNSIATTLSEIAVPANVVTVLQALGATRLVYIVDNDYAGYLSAINWRDALRGSGIDFEAHTWGKIQTNKIHTDKHGNEYPYIACDDVADKLDGNDIWIQLAFNRPAFRQWLADVPALPLPAMQERAQATHTETVDITEPLAHAIHEALAPHFTGKKHKGWLMHKCVHHDDAHASAGFNPQNGIINCFACGSHSPYQTADVLGIDWKAMYPKREYAPRNAPLPTPVQQSAIEHQFAEYAALREEILSTVINQAIELAELEMYYASAEGINEQIRAFHAAYLAGHYRRSWWHSDTENVEKPQKKVSKIRRILNEMQAKERATYIPLGQLSAILNLNNNRSATALVLGRMHTAFMDGRLSSAVFSIPLVASVINLSPRMVTNAFIELTGGGYIQFLRTDSLYNILYPLYNKILPSQTVDNPYLNMHPARLYTLNLDKIALQENLFNQLSIQKTEAYHARSSATVSLQMADDMDLEHHEYKALREIDRLAEKDPLSKRARAELNTELYGDSKGKWRGWKHALESDFALAIDWFACESIKDVRGAILRAWAKIRPQNSRTQLCRLLGCSDATLQSIMDTYDVISIRQNREEKIENPEFSDLRQRLKEIMRDEGASIWKVAFKLKSEEGWQATNQAYAGLFYAENRADIEKIYIRYIVPSVLALKSVASWALKWQQFIVCVAYWMIVKRATLIADYESNPEAHAEGMIAIEIQPMERPKQDREPVTPRTETIEAQHIYTEHKGSFIWKQLGAKVFMYTGYQLVGDCVVNGDLPAGVVYQAIGTELARRRGIAQFIIGNRADKLVNKASDYFGLDIEDYDAETDAALKAQRETEIKAWYDSLVPEFDMPPADKVIQMPLDNAKPQNPELTERQKLQLEFWNNRLEREHGVKPGQGVFTLPAYALVTESWTDASGLLYEVRGEDLFVDGMKQYMTPELWNYVSRYRKSA